MIRPPLLLSLAYRFQYRYFVAPPSSVHNVNNVKNVQIAPLLLTGTCDEKERMPRKKLPHEASRRLQTPSRATALEDDDSDDHVPLSQLHPRRRVCQNPLCKARLRNAFQWFCEHNVYCQLRRSLLLYCASSVRHPLLTSASIEQEKETQEDEETFSIPKRKVPRKQTSSAMERPSVKRKTRDRENEENTTTSPSKVAESDSETSKKRKVTTERPQNLRLAVREARTAAQAIKNMEISLVPLGAAPMVPGGGRYVQSGNRTADQATLEPLPAAPKPVEAMAPSRSTPVAPAPAPAPAPVAAAPIRRISASAYLNSRKQQQQASSSRPSSPVRSASSTADLSSSSRPTSPRHPSSRPSSPSRPPSRPLSPIRRSRPPSPSDSRRAQVDYASSRPPPVPIHREFRRAHSDTTSDAWRSSYEINHFERREPPLYGRSLERRSSSSDLFSSRDHRNYGSPYESTRYDYDQRPDANETNRSSRAPSPSPSSSAAASSASSLQSKPPDPDTRLYNRRTGRPLASLESPVFSRRDRFLPELLSRMASFLPKCIGAVTNQTKNARKMKFYIDYMERVKETCGPHVEFEFQTTKAVMMVAGRVWLAIESASTVDLYRLILSRLLEQAFGWRKLIADCQRVYRNAKAQMGHHIVPGKSFSTVWHGLNTGKQETVDLNRQVWYFRGEQRYHWRFDVENVELGSGSHAQKTEAYRSACDNAMKFLLEMKLYPENDWHKYRRSQIKAPAANTRPFASHATLERTPRHKAAYSPIAQSESSDAGDPMSRSDSETDASKPAETSPTATKQPSPSTSTKSDLNGAQPTAPDVIPTETGCLLCEMIRIRRPGADKCVKCGGGGLRSTTTASTTTV